MGDAKRGGLLIHLRNLLSNLLQALRSRSHESKVRPRRRQDSGKVLWVILHTDEPWVVLQLDDLHTLALIILSNKVQSTLGQTINVLWVNLVSVTVTLVDLLSLSVKRAELRPLGSRLELCRAEAETHGSSHGGLVNLWHEHDDWVLSLLVQLCRGSSLHGADVASELDNSDLHTEADTQVWSLVLTCVLRSLDHTLSTTVSETTWNQNSVGSADLGPCLVELSWAGGLRLVLEVGGIDPEEVELTLAAHGGMLERLDDGEVGVVEGDVLSNQGDGDLLEVVADAGGELVPLGPGALAAGNQVLGLWNGIELENVADGGDHALVLKEDWDVVSGANVVYSNNLLWLDLAEHGDLVGSGFLKWNVASASD